MLMKSCPSMGLHRVSLLPLCEGDVDPTALVLLPFITPYSNGQSLRATLQAVLGLIDARDDGWTPVATVHRVVHGGPAFRAPVLVTPEVIAQLQALLSPYFEGIFKERCWLQPLPCAAE